MTSPNDKALTIRSAGVPNALIQFTEKQWGMIRTVVPAEIKESDIPLFMGVCETLGLNPFLKQIYAIPRSGKMSIQIGIDGYRSVGLRTGRIDGTEGPEWCGDDGKWRNTWPSNLGNPTMCRFGIYEPGSTRPVWGVVTYASRKGDSPFWKHPDKSVMQIAKCAEAMAWRMIRPALSGTYIPEEMEGEDEPQRQAPRRRSAVTVDDTPADEAAPPSTELDSEVIEGETRELPPEAPTTAAAETVETPPLSSTGDWFADLEAYLKANRISVNLITRLMQKNFGKENCLEYMKRQQLDWRGLVAKATEVHNR